MLDSSFGCCSFNRKFSGKSSGVFSFQRAGTKSREWGGAGFPEAFDASSRLLERRVKAPGPRKPAGVVRQLPSVGADQRSRCAQD